MTTEKEPTFDDLFKLQQDEIDLWFKRWKTSQTKLLSVLAVNNLLVAALSETDPERQRDIIKSANEKMKELDKVE
jgi:hypothetical protein